jgi:transcription termination factor Rho
VAAAALEQSMLESKDKDTLLEMAKALGVKVNARLKKSDIIDKILDTTGSGPSSAPVSAPGVVTGRADARIDREPADREPADRDPADRDPADRVTVAASDPAPALRDEPGPSGSNGSGSAPTDIVEVPTVLLGPDGEPLADWEIELVRSGESGPGSTANDSTANDSTADDATANGSDRSGDRPNGQRTRGGQQAGGQPRNRNDQGANRNDGNRNEGNRNEGNRNEGNRNDGNRTDGNRTDGNRNNDLADGNRRRRRRRKGRGGQEGPQGEDVELIEQDLGFESSEPVDVAGYLDIRDEGYGFLRVNGYLPSKEDAYIPLKLARQYGLRKGDHLTGKVRPAGRNEKNPGLLEVYTVNGADPELAKKRPHFESLTALFPDQRLTLEDPSDPANMTARIIDLVCPIGKGQRGIIVSPPKAGKTTIMKTIAKSIELNNPEVHLMVLLIDERPEEVTDMRRSVKGEVISSTFDRPSDEHTHVAEMTIAKARRMVEDGRDVVIMLDGITRLSRAYNLAAPASGKILSGGIDAGALYPPKKFFGSARNVEEGGSLTILATALVDTNSRMDEAIFEEFKGTGNMELRLDRKVAERRIYPAIDVDASSTRHEELLFDRKQLQQVWKLRRVLSGLAQDGSAAAGLELLIDRLKTFRTNDEFLAEIAKQPSM